jgi:hypothetical protein
MRILFGRSLSACLTPAKAGGVPTSAERIIDAQEQAGRRRLLLVRFLDGLVKSRFSADLFILTKARIQSFQGALDTGSGPA